MTNLTPRQIKKANKLLKYLCEHDKIDMNYVYSLFDSTEEANSTCYKLRDKRKAISGTFGNDRFYKISKNDNTLSFYKNNILLKEYRENRIKSILSYLKIISLTFSIILNIVLLTLHYQTLTSKHDLENKLLIQTNLADTLEVKNAFQAERIKELMKSQEIH